MTEWWTSLDLFMKILWSIAIATSLIFIIETILTFIGIDHEIDADFDTSMDGGFESEPSMNLYTFRNLVNFLLGMSWTAILLKEKIVSTLVELDKYATITEIQNANTELAGLKNQKITSSYSPFFKNPEIQKDFGVFI